MKILLVIIAAALAVSVSGSRVKAPDLCSDCTKLFTDVRDRLVSSETAAKVEALVDQYVCNLLVIGKEQCSSLVKTSVSTYLRFISNLIQPNTICAVIQACKPQPPRARSQHLLMEQTLKISSLFPRLSAHKTVGAPDLCADCTTFFGDIKTRLTGPATVKQIESLINQYFCNLLVIGKDQCTSICNTIVSSYLGFLSQLINPTTTCTLLTYCQPSPPMYTTKLSSQDTLNLFGKFLRLHSSQKVGAPDLCADCTTFFGDVKTRLTGPATVKQIEDAINQYFCSLLVIGKEQCNALSKTIVSTYLGFLSKLINPATTCALLTYCQPTPPMWTRQKLNVEAPDLCADCTTFFGDIKTRLTGPATVKQIESLIDQYVCNLLVIGKDQCTSFSNTIVSSYLGLLSQLIKPKMTCTLLTYCQPSPPMFFTPGKITPVKFSWHDIKLFGKLVTLHSTKRVGAPDLCADCTTLFDDVKSRITSPETSGQIVTYVNMFVCNFLPPTFKMGCSMFAQTATSTLLNFYSSLINSDTICKLLAYCLHSPSFYFV